MSLSLNLVIPNMLQSQNTAENIVHFNTFHLKRVPAISAFRLAVGIPLFMISSKPALC